MDFEKIRELVRRARNEGRRTLLETEGLEILTSMGISVPNSSFLSSSADMDGFDLSPYPGERVVVKVVSPEILHKSDVGGVTFVPKDRASVQSAVKEMEALFSDRDVRGYLISERVSYDPSLGGELLVGIRFTEDFGPVITFGPGGIYTEFLADHFKTGRDVAILSPEGLDGDVIRHELDHSAVTRLIAGGFRGQKARIDMDHLVDIVMKFSALAEELVPEFISEFEVNPFVIRDGDLIPLDALVSIGAGNEDPSLKGTRPIKKIRHLLEPETAAIIGVSEKMNPGHIILHNLLREGFNRENIYIVKPGSDHIEGCRCFPDIVSLPLRVDLFILAVSAGQVPEIIREITDGKKAESLIVIPGGLEEKEGTEAIVREMQKALENARQSDWGGPVINGGNCLGVRSQPGKYDTMFIPEYKLPVPAGEVSPVAFISQSGAFAVSKTNKLAGVNPKYSISIGNQMDLTIGDYLTYLKEDPEIDIYAVYVEGFKPMDGFAFLRAAEELTRSGRTVILYRAGRTSAGAKASASHTASIAGDYSVTRALCRRAGVIVADTLADFEDLTQLFAFLKTREVRGIRLGAVSNAGFECVTIADNLGRFDLASFSPETVRRLSKIFETSRISSIVDIHNPIDLTPMTADEAYESVIRAVLDEPTVDVGVVGCVPLTPALNTLPPGEGHRDNFHLESSIVMRMAKIIHDHPKAWVAVVDGGAIYDPMARLMESRGIPTFRTADRALRLFNIFCLERLRTQGNGRAQT